MAKQRKRYAFKVVLRDDAEQRAERFKRLAKGLPVEGLENPLHGYGRKVRTRTRLVEASWAHVLLLACCYAIGINILKICWYEAFGKIDYQLAQPKTSVTTSAQLVPSTPTVQ